MATQLEETVRVGGSRSRTVALTPQARWLRPAASLLYGIVMVVVMRRELGFYARAR